MTKAKTKAPVELGYSMPAEWARHESTWLSWPKNPLTFPPEILPKVEAAYVQMVEALAKEERVDLLVNDEKAEERVRSQLSAKNVAFHRIASADVWMRDYGPIFVRKGGRTPAVAATKWEFNAWGRKYDDLLPDNEAGVKVAKSTGVKVFKTGVVLEGGSIDVNGTGTLLTTKQCLLNKNRNPGLSKAQLEADLHDYLGATSVVWLGKGVAGDDTDGHVDDIARFVNEDTIICMDEPDEGDVNHAALQRDLTLLARHRDNQGRRRFEVVPIEMPRGVEAEGERLPASYANFYIGNSAVLVPVFGDARRDGAALDTLSEYFHGRKMVPVDCRELVYGFGGIHCVSQQQPAP